MSRERRAAARPVLRKQLVAHYDRAWQRMPGSPMDGDPVGPLAPCDRLRAGYWCDCGSGFARDPQATEDREVPTARIELGLGPGGWFLEDDPWFRHGGRVTDDDRALLQRQIDGLDVGTVVERHGIGIAPRFEEFPP